MYDTTENVWTDVYKEVAGLLAPTQNQLSQMGPKSHPLPEVTSSGPVLQPVSQPVSLEQLPNLCAVRAEGSRRSPLRLGESTSLGVDETAGHIHPRLMPSGRKKSWLRAVRRVQLRGHAVYQGRHWSRQHIPEKDFAYVTQQFAKKSSVSGPRGFLATVPSGKLCPNRSSVPDTRDFPVSTKCQAGRQDSQGRRHRTIKFMAWNCGGLPVAKFDELLLWSSEHGIDIIALSETRRKHDAVWTSGPYTMFQTGESVAGNSYSGVMLGIRQVHQARHSVIIPGRLLHVHLVRQDLATALDVVVAYVKPISLEAPEDVQMATLEARLLVWQALDKLLATIPKRHSLLLLGDLNTHVPLSHMVFASGDPSGRVSSDADELVHLCIRHELAHGHSHQRSGRATYRSSRTSGGTRIDYAFIRRAMVPCCSNFKLVWDLPFIDANPAGHHCVLQGELRCSWSCWRTSTTTSSRPPLYNVELLRDAQQVGHATSVAFQQALQDQLSSSGGSLEEVCNLVHQVGLQFFSRPRQAKAPPPWSSQQLRDASRSKWSALSHLRAIASSFSLTCIFQQWHAVTQVWRTTRLHKMLGRQMRRSWLESIFKEASDAAYRRDPSFFRFVRILSPKSCRLPFGVKKRLQEAQTLEDELLLFAAHFQHIFSASAGMPTLSTPSWTWQTPMTCSDLDIYFNKIPLFKSVPSGHTIGAVWRLALQVPGVRSCIDDTLASFPTKGIPRRFCDGSLVLLPKPGKSGKEVTHYRPLVLQCPLGKSILKGFASRVLAHVRPQLLRHPQFAYLPGRNAEMAIWRVESFLRQCKHDAGHVIPPPAWLRAGGVAPHLSGCLLVSLDLSQAFDTVDRVQLMQCLQSLEIPSDLLGAIWAWHLDPAYLLRLGNLSRMITTSRGVRQGCTLAPTLWIIFLYDVVEKLCRAHPGIDWLGLITAYADDIMLCFKICSAKDLESALDSTLKLLAQLKSSGLTVNMQKTQFLLKLTGTYAKKLYAKYTYSKSGQRYLRLSQEHSPVLTQCIEYLGVRLTWGSSSDTTLAHRLACGRKTYAMLQPWWRSSLSRTTKARLFTSVVLPSTTYGLSSTGLSVNGKKLLQRSVMRYLRRIVGSQSFLTRESDIALLHRMNIVPVADKVSLGCVRLLRRIGINLSLEVCPAYGYPDFIAMHHNTYSTWWQTLLAGLVLVSFPFRECSWESVLYFVLRLQEFLLHEAGLLASKVCFRSSLPALTEEAPAYECPDCGRTFLSYTRLRSHQHHGFCTWHRETHTFDPCIDARSELPICFWCRHEFKWWSNLKTHIACGQCPRLADRAEHLLRAGHLPRRDAPLHAGKDLSKHCIMCGRWCRFARSLSYHLRSAHLEAYNQGRQAYRELDPSTIKSGRTCPFCHAPAAPGNIRSHLRGHCVVLLQRCMIGASNPLSNSWLSGADAPNSTPSPPVQELVPHHHAASSHQSLRTYGHTASRCLGGSLGATDQASKITRRIRFKRPDPRCSNISREHACSSQAQSQQAQVRRRRRHKSGTTRQEFSQACAATRRSSPSTLSGLRLHSTPWQVTGSQCRRATGRRQQGLEACNGDSPLPDTRTSSSSLVQTHHEFPHEQGCRSDKGGWRGECQTVLERLSSLLRDGMAGIIPEHDRHTERPHHDCRGLHKVDGGDVCELECRSGGEIEGAPTVVHLEPHHDTPCTDSSQPYQSIRPPSLGDHASTLKNVLLEDDRWDTSHRARQVEPTRRTDSSPSVQAQGGLDSLACPLRLANPRGVACYLNALVFTTWQLLRLEALSRLELPELLREGLESLSDIPCDLFCHPIWLRILEGWELGHQEDPHELLHFLLHRFAVPSFWGSMRIDHISHNSSESQQFCTLGVPIPENDAALSLHDLLAHWWTSQDEDGHTCIITEAPNILVLQLLRYQYRNGQAYRIPTHVVVGHEVHLPCSGISSVDSTLYHTRAIILHLGESPRHGHYTTLLTSRTGVGWYMNDKAVPHEMSSECPLVRRLAYLIILQKHL